MREEARAVLDRAALRVGRGVIEPAQPRVADRAGAHRAGLERHVEIAVGQPLRRRAWRRPARSDDHFGMGGRVASRRACGCRRWRSPCRRAPAPRRSAPRRAARPRAPRRRRRSSGRRSNHASTLRSPTSRQRLPACGATARDALATAARQAARTARRATQAEAMTETDADQPHHPGQRIAKVMARAGLCSRRDAEAWIAAGRVSVNGEILTSPAFNVVDERRRPRRRRAARRRTSARGCSCSTSRAGW